MATERQKFIWAVGQLESSGNYKAVNKSSGALGRWQVMPSNVASWTRQALGKSLTPSKFLNSPSAQDAVADKILGGYYDKYGVAGGASAWFSGSPKISNKSDGSTTVPQYVLRVKQLMNDPKAGSAGSASGSGVEQAVSLNPLSWADAASKFFEFVSDPINWMRLGMILGGGIGVAVGLFMMSGQANRLGQAAKTAVNVLPQGRALKAASGAATAAKAAA